MERDDVWSVVRGGVDSLIREAAAGDAALERFLRRKLENWAIDQGSGKVMNLKSRLKKEVYQRQNGLCAECGQLLHENNWELDRLDASFADDPDQGYRSDNVRGVHPHCNPRGPYPAGRVPTIGAN